jgi:Bacterial Ig-like domain (group 2)
MLNATRISLAAVLMLSWASCEGSDGVTGPPAVVPEAPAPALGIEPGAALIKNGEKLQFRALGTLVQAVPALFAITWATSDPQVAEINSLGLLTAKGIGSVRVTVTVAGQSASANVVVTANASGDGPGYGRNRPQSSQR